ncbi:sarcolemmal membrane-associated protein-like isoform X1 [Ptychodera flava]|uniref:sarcolemmal membrane-associated protein-like isoform X1 n=1 Tax=Ptychodera flava TaxID=63121 RepID=UPI00396A3D7A
MTAIAVFTCRPNSHPFQERRVPLNEPVKIGRSVARCKPTANNAIFDCKVLSRNHALLWYEGSKFYLQDTKSSNGTFVNNQRLSKGAEESPAREINSGDIIQFGVDVMENSRRGVVTHGCIISTLTLYTPDGKEAKSPMNTLMAYSSSCNMQSQDLYELNHYLQEALHREQMLEQKLAALQRIVANTQEASENSWQALINEDRLLSRLEVLETQLQSLSKAQPEESIRKELVALQEDKHKYETTAKESLRRVLQEKLDAVRKLSDLERSFSNTEDELAHVKESHEETQTELNKLCEKHNQSIKELQELAVKLDEKEKTYQDDLEQAEAQRRELETKLEETQKQEESLSAQVESLQADRDFVKEQLQATKARLDSLQSHTSETAEMPVKDTSIDISQGQGDGADTSILDKTDGDGQEDVTMQVVEDVNTNETVLEPQESSSVDSLPNAHVSIDPLSEQYKAKLEESLQEKQVKIDSLQAQLDQARLEAIQNIAKAQSLEDRLSETEKDIDEKVENAIGDLTARLKEAEKKNDRSEELARRLQEQLSNIDDRILNNDGHRPQDSMLLTKLPDQLGNIHNHIGQHKKDALDETLEEPLTTLPTDNEVDSAPEGTQNSSQEIHRLQGLLSESKEKLRMSGIEVSKLKNELSESQEATEKALHENMQLKDQLMEAKQEAKHSTAHAVDLQEQLNRAEASAKEVREQILALRDQLLEEQETAKVNYKEAENLRSVLAKEKEFQKQREVTVDEIKKQLLDAQQSAKQSHNETEQLRSQFKELQSSLDKEKKERHKQTQEANQASKAAKELQRQTKKYEEETTRNKDNADDTENGNNEDYDDINQQSPSDFDMPADLNGLREECTSLRKKIQVIENDLRKSKKDNSRLTQDFNRLQSQFKDLEAERIKLEDKENSWKKDLKEARRETDKARKELSEANKEMEKLQTKCKSCIKENEDLHKEVQQLKIENENVGARANKVTSVVILSAIVLLFAMLSRLFSGVFGSSAESEDQTLS